MERTHVVPGCVDVVSSPVVAAAVEMLVNSVVLSCVVVLRCVENTLRQGVNVTLWLHLPLAIMYRLVIYPRRF